MLESTKLSRTEMKNVLGGLYGGGGLPCEADECTNGKECPAQYPICHTANCNDEDGSATYTFCGNNVS